MNEILKTQVEIQRRCMERMKLGQKKYGRFSHLKRDMNKELLDELLDARNYIDLLIDKLELLKLDNEIKRREKVIEHLNNIDKLQKRLCNPPIFLNCKCTKENIDTSYPHICKFHA